MRQKIFFILSTVFFIFSFSAGQVLACTGGGCQPSVALAGSSSNSGANADATANVGVIAAGGGGGSASATGGTAINHTVVSPHISPEINPRIDFDAEINPGQTVAPEQELSIDSHDKVVNDNRQFLMPGTPALVAPSAYFGPWVGEAYWNLFPINIGEEEPTPGTNREIKFERVEERVYYSLTPISDNERVLVFVTAPSLYSTLQNYRALQMADAVYLLREEEVSTSAIDRANYLASKIGANVVEIIRYKGRMVSQSYAQALAGGAVNAGGLMGGGHTTSVSGGIGGIGVSKNTQVQDIEPWSQFRLWRVSAEQYADFAKKIIAHNAAFRQMAEKAAEKKSEKTKAVKNTAAKNK